MNLDRDAIRFKGKAMKVAIDLNGSLSGEEAASFLDQLYLEFQADKSQRAPEAWLRTRLSTAFRSVAEPPAWVEDEPSWQFYQGIPMVFLTQTTIPENDFSKDYLSPGETVYLFGIRQPVAGGYKMIYRTVSQFGELSRHAR